MDNGWDQVNRLTSAMETLTEISDGIQSKVVHKRYRDVSATVRASVIEGLTDIMLALPEVFVQVRAVEVGSLAWVDGSSCACFVHEGFSFDGGGKILWGRGAG